MTRTNSFTLPHGLIVSCQALEDEPLHGPQFMAAMAHAAEMGGAVGIRANSPVDIAAIRQMTKLPIIGLYKIHTDGSPVYITPDCEAAEQISRAGCDIIAIDATPFPRRNGVTLQQLIDFIHTDLKKPVMADCSCEQDAALAESFGADIVSTTLAGYTAHGRPAMDGPDLEFLAALVARMRVPVVAEGRFDDPAQVTRGFEIGAAAIVVGGAITRPQEITRRFVRAVPSR
ncbi:MAG: N-acetylmannosamine-6-phosphate 2-epimerase [Chloroflexota bacterium]|nr:MAG: N-acetylmannosamine-6-phosphate 2-epimerase [Chloroflexota bacterium]